MLIHWVNTNNYTSGRLNRVVAIVDHISQSPSIEGIVSWFQNPASQASSTYLVGLDGSITQMVRLQDTPWTNGVNYGNALPNPDRSIPWLSAALDERQDINSYCVTIEHEGYSGQVFPEAQYQATLSLHKFIIQQVSNLGIGTIPIDGNHIIGHCRIDSVNRAHCPGPTFPFSRLLSDLMPAPSGQSNTTTTQTKDNTEVSFNETHAFTSRDADSLHTLFVDPQYHNFILIHSRSLVPFTVTTTKTDGTKYADPITMEPGHDYRFPVVPGLEGMWVDFVNSDGALSWITVRNL